MRNVVPRLIARGIASGSHHGRLNACVLYVDLAGFTRFTQVLMRKGRKGAEEVSEAINAVYRPALRRVLAADGSIVSFIGDAFIALFPPGKQQEMKHLESYMAKWLPGRLAGVSKAAKLHTGFACGEVEWAICPCGSRLMWYTRGAAISMACKQSYRPAKGTKVLNSAAAVLAPGIAGLRITPSVARRFVPQGIVSMPQGGEFRTVSPLFIRFDEQLNHNDLTGLIAVVGKVSEAQGGYVNGIFFDEKGGYILVVFGAPVSMERARERAAATASTLLNKLQQPVGMGLAYGKAFAGFTGSVRRCCYTVIGDVVNTAARLAFSAPMGSCYIEEKSSFGFSAGMVVNRQKVPIKGRKPVSVVCLKRGDTYLRDRVYPVYGRQMELQVLRKWLQAGGQGQIVVVTGPAGVGKSRLVAEMPYVLGGDVFFMRTHALEPERFGLTPLARLAAGLLRCHTVQPAEAELAKAWSRLPKMKTGPHGKEDSAGEWQRSVLSWMLAAGPTPAAIGEDLAMELSAALAWLCEQCRLPDTTIFLVEDLHWMSTIVIQVLAGFAGAGHTVLATSRVPLKDLQAAIGQARELVLQPLEEDSANSLAAVLLQGEPDKRLRQFLRIRCQGNPFLLSQFCRHMLENQLVRYADGMVRLAALPDAIPYEVDEVVAARLDRGAPQLRETVVAAAVLGEEFYLQELRLMVSVPIEQPLLFLGQQAGFWAPGAEEGKWMFSHALLRDSVYNMLLGRRLRELHLRAYEAVTRRQAADPATLGKRAYHLEWSGRPQQAWPLYEQAADKAKMRFLHEESLRFYQAAERCLPGERVADRLRIRGKMCLPLEHMGRLDDAMTLYKESITMARQAGERRHLGRMLLSGGRLLCLRGELQEGLDYLRRARRIFLALKDVELLGAVYSNIGLFHFRTGNYGSATKYATRSLKLARQAGNLEHQCMAEGMLAVMKQNDGHYKEALKMYRSQLELARKLELRSCELTALVNMGSVYTDMGDDVHALACYRENLEIAENNDLVVDKIAGLNSLAWFYMHRRDFGTAEGMFSEALELSKQTGHYFRECSSLVNLAELNHQLKREGRALRLAQQAVKMAEKKGFKEIYQQAVALIKRLPGGDKDV